MLPDRPYTREELLKIIGDALPERGTVCPECGTRIPQFAELADADEQRIRELIRSGRKIMAIQELRSIIGCPLAWAKIWVEHSG